MNTKSGIKNEIDRIENALIGGQLTDKQYCELYAVQQSLSWAMNPNLVASPFDTVMNGKIQPLIKDAVSMDIPAN